MLSRNVTFFRFHWFLTLLVLPCFFFFRLLQLDSVREETEKLEQRHPYSHLIDSIIDLASEKFPEYRQETTQPVVQPEPQIRHGSESHTSSKSKSIPLLEASLPQAQPRMGLRSQSRALEQAETSLGTTNQQTDVPHGSGDVGLIQFLSVVDY